MIHLRALAIVLVTLGSFIASSHGAQPATFTGTGFLPGGSFSFATNVSADGSVILGSSSSSSGQIGFKWTAAGGIQGIPFPPGNGNGAQGVNGISRDGAILVGSAFGDVAFQWTAATGSVALASPGFSAAATAISPDGQVVTGFGSVTSANPPQVLVWDAAGLHETGISIWGNESWGVSDAGHVVAGTMTGPSGGPEGFIWSAGAGVEPLGSMGGSLISEARAISSNGNTIVGSVTSSSGFRQAAYWTQAHGWQTIGELPGGDSGSQAMGVSANGSVIVGQVNTTEGLRAFIWDSADGMQLLQNVLGLEGANPDGWALNWAQSVSDDGLTLAGGGTDPAGKEDGWVATISSVSVPEATPLTCLGLVGVTMFLRRNRFFLHQRRQSLDE